MIVAELVVSTSLVGIALLVWNFVINKWQSCENSCVQENKGRSFISILQSPSHLNVQTMKAFVKVNISVLGVLYIVLCSNTIQI